MRVLSVILWLCLCATAQAQDLDAVDAAFASWLDAVGANGVLTVWRGGAKQATFAHGMAADTPVELASLSKAITGVCVLDLIAEGVWRPDTTAREVLGTGGTVTVAQLLTHTSGLGPDGTQGLDVSFLPVARGRAHEVGAIALERGVDADLAGQFSYNNENYAVLADMIAAETGVPYADACQTRALGPAGVTGKPSDVVGPMLAWGGWAMTVADYARFHWHWFGPEGRIGADPGRWPRHAFEGEGYFYGPGIFQRPMNGAQNFWHFGAHCFPAQLNVGAFTVSWFGDWSAVAAYDACLEWPQMVALDNTLARAVLGGGE